MALAAAGVAVAALAAALALAAAWLLPLLAVAVAAAMVGLGRRRGAGGLQIDQIERLRQAELALASAPTTEVAARELAEHATALLGARSATVLIEGIGDTVRVTAGAPGDLYGDGSRMRLLDDGGVPCGSIAVGPRGDGRPYSAQQERMLDALAQRVSSTLHRLALFERITNERRMLADVLESSSDGIITVGLDMAVRSWNPVMERITGTPAAEAIGLPVGAVLRPVDETGRLLVGSADPGRCGDPRSHLVRVEGPGGQQRWLLASWAPLSEGGYVLIARDETERKKLQEDKDAWIAQVSHELRTPLTPIKGFLQTLQRYDAGLTDGDRQRIYEVALRETQRLENLVADLLAATRLDNAPAPAGTAVVDWPATVGQRIEAAQRADPSRPIELTTDGPPPHVLTDAALAGGVLAHLLSNAQKFAPEATPITVRIHTEEGLVWTTVCDRGPGVPAEDRERIFEKFTRLGDHLTRPQQGVGLGLYIARRTAEQLGGTIVCGAAPGGGAAFRFSLPAHLAPGGPAPAKRAGPGRPGLVKRS